MSTYDSVDIEQPGFKMAITIHVGQHSDSDYEAQEVMARKKAYAPILASNAEWIQKAAIHFLSGDHGYKRFHGILKKNFQYKAEMGFKGIHRSFPLKIPLLRPNNFIDSSLKFSVPYPSEVELAFYMEPDNFDKYELIESLFWGSQLNNKKFLNQLVSQVEFLNKESFIEKVKFFVKSPGSVGVRMSYQFPLMIKHKEKLEEYSRDDVFTDKERSFLQVWNRFLTGKPFDLNSLGFKESQLLPLAHTFLDDEGFKKFQSRGKNEE